VAINLRDVVLFGPPVTATATATLSNGQTEAVTTGWRSDAPTIASVTDAGAVSGLANGEANITVSRGGQQASKRIRVAPNYDGSWQGSLRITGCFDWGLFAGACQGADAIGTLISVGLTLRHPGDLAVSGEVVVDVLSYPTISTLVESHGRARFTSVTTSDQSRVEMSGEMSAQAAGGMLGIIRERYTATGFDGELILDSVMVNVARTSAAMAATALPLAAIGRIRGGGSGQQNCPLSWRLLGGGRAELQACGLIY
jgi:hypothetical protein